MRLVDVVRRQRAGRRVGGERAAGLRDVPAAAIGHGDDQPQPEVALGQLFGVVHAPREFRAQQRAIADEAQAHLIAVQSPRLPAPARRETNS
jgi:hypothetical protein